MPAAPRAPLTALVFLVACGAKPTAHQATPDASPVALAAFSSAYVAAYCAFEVRCGQMSDVTFCEAFAAAGGSEAVFNSLSATLAATNAGKVAYDPDAAGNCLATITSLDCNTVFNSPNPRDVAACSGVFTGRLASMESCITDDECPSGGVCVNSSASQTGCAGTCGTVAQGTCDSSAQCSGGKVCDSQLRACVTPVPAGGQGNACGTNFACQSGLFCDQTQVPPSCESLPQSGAACDPTVNLCAAGLLCVASNDLSSGTCMTAAALGQPCQSLFQCGGTLGSNICDPASGTCVARASTGPCIGGSIYGCDLLTSYCDLSNPLTPTCAAIVSAGAACNPQITGQCGLFGGNACVATESGMSGVCETSGGAANCTP